MDANLSLAFWTKLLHLADFGVAHVAEDSVHQRLVFMLTPVHDIGLCPHCGRASNTIKQRRTREAIHDLPMGPQAVELTIRVNQYSCEQCERAFTPPIPFLADGSHATERFLERAAKLIRTSDVSNAAKFLGVPERTLDGWYLAWVERQQAASSKVPETPIRRIGIDELALKKGTGNSSR
jgi:transposase